MRKLSLRVRRIIPLLLLGSLATVAAASGGRAAAWRPPVVMEVDMIIMQAQSGKPVLPGSAQLNMMNGYRQQDSGVGNTLERYAAIVSRGDNQLPRDAARATASRIETKSYRLHF